MNQEPRPDEVAFHRPLRFAVTALILLGASLAATAAILSLTHHALTHAPAFVAVTLVLTFDAVLVWRHNRWAVLVTLLGLAGQATAMAGLIYSSIGFALFGWFAVRWLAARRLRR